MKKVILASRSPRRLDILRQHGIEPVVLPTDTEEILPDNIGMEEAVRLLALQKAQACYNEIRNNRSYRDSVIIGSDTIVYKDRIMGKPADASDAFRMLASIRNDVHYVSTGVALIDFNTGEERVLSDVTRVICKDYTDAEIWEYIEKEQPYDKAGSYAIQGPFGRYIDRIEGDYENVVGLPYHIIREYLEDGAEG